MLPTTTKAKEKDGYYAFLWHKIHKGLAIYGNSWIRREAHKKKWVYFLDIFLPMINRQYRSRNRNFL